jgi:hypothetical protein
MNEEEKKLLREMCLLSCAKNGYISIRKAAKRLGWHKQKIIAIGNFLAIKGILNKHYVCTLNSDHSLDSYWVNSF